MEYRLCLSNCVSLTLFGSNAVPGSSKSKAGSWESGAVFSLVERILVSPLQWLVKNVSSLTKALAFSNVACSGIRRHMWIGTPYLFVQ